MVSANEGNGSAADATVIDRRMSTVVPGVMAGYGRVLGLTNLDLALKLHYLRMVYYFPAPPAGGDGGGGGGGAAITAAELKNPMFRLLVPYFPTCGRIRRSSSGRPVLKCNDGGVRIVEARCGATLADWLEKKKPSPHPPLAPEKVLGPDMSFSAPVVVQFTRFQCGGLAVGFSWSHVIGDAVSAASFAGNCFRAINGDPPPQPHQLHKSPARVELPAAAAPLSERPTNAMEDETVTTGEPKKKPFSAAAAAPLSVRAVKTVDGCWLPAGEVKMESLSLEITGDQVEVLRDKTLARSSFDAIAAVVWQSLARIRGTSREPRMVTVCKSGDQPSGRSWLLGNDQVVGVVRAAELSPAAADLSELAKLLAGGFSDETPAIEALAGADSGGPPDLILYGANLSFVDLEDLPVYDVAVRGQRPVFVNFTIEGVGREGTVLVFPGGGPDGGGRTVNAVLPGGEAAALMRELRTACGGLSWSGKD